MAWTVEYTDEARKKLKKLDPQIAGRIMDFMARIEDPRQKGSFLAGTLSEYWRYRVGDYRVLCRLQDEIITILVVDLGHRKEIYR